VIIPCSAVILPPYTLPIILCLLPLIKTSAFLTILKFSFELWVKRILDIGFARYVAGASGY
jgi:hypothetical protein